ncbi:MAG: YabP/YqfC family sporulation protein [Clostridia bacterium]|nr:YabP/YqfC family sporulation protein [Clostridia bacterium]
MSRYRNMINALMTPDDFDTAQMRGFVCMHTAAGRVLTVDGHRGILHYDKGEVTFRAKNMDVQVLGQELCIAAYNRTHLKITGVISAVNMRRYEP